MITFRHILVPTDFGAASIHAADVGADLAHRFGSSLTILHVSDLGAIAFATVGAGPQFATLDIATSLEDAARTALDKELARVRRQMPNALGVLRSGVSWREILSTAEEAAADLIVMGTHGRQGMQHLVVGSVTEKVVRMAKIGVFAVHAPTVIVDDVKAPIVASDE